jgi:hypothetical protein
MTSDFPTKENPKLCNNGCGRKIYLSNDTGKWLAYNLDDTQHDCRDKDRPKKETKQEFTLDSVRKKLESIGISLDLEKLMNQK